MKLSALLLVIFLAGCASTAKNMDYVSTGMSKSAVIYVLGEPSETRASEEVEYMIYELRSTPDPRAQAGCGAAGVATLGLAYAFKGCQYSDDAYYIQLKQGKVTAYGRIGELPPAQGPDSAINANGTTRGVD